LITACCDIGNTKIKIGLFDDDQLTEFLTFHTMKDAVRSLRSVKPDEVVISSVVPQKSQTIVDFCRYERGMDAFIIDKDKKYRLEIDYKTPESLGVDRICSSEAAFKIYSETNELHENEIMIVADFGTAITIDIITSPNIFSGGLIAPGPGLLFKAMKLYTAQLPEAFHSDYTGMIGKDTKSCIASGVVNSVTGLINRVYNSLSETNKIAAIFITGGNAHLFLNDFNFEYNYKPDLLLLGMKSIFDLNTRNK
jgi:type III pantothenate kinase